MIGEDEMATKGAASGDESGGGGKPDFSCLRLTTKKVPENAGVKDRSGLPFGVTVQPFKPLPRFPLDPSVLLESADSIARCGECFGYVNGFCGFERDGWICILCGNFSYWSDAGHHGSGKPRYRRNPRRNELPEIANTEVEVEVAREMVTVDPRNPLGTAPVYVALVDLAAPEETLELVRSAVLAAIEAVGPDALFGIVTFSNRVGLYDVQGAVPSVRHVAVVAGNPATPSPQAPPHPVRGAQSIACNPRVTDPRLKLTRTPISGQPWGSSPPKCMRALHV